MVFSKDFRGSLKSLRLNGEKIHLNGISGRSTKNYCQNFDHLILQRKISKIRMLNDVCKTPEVDLFEIIEIESFKILTHEILKPC